MLRTFAVRWVYAAHIVSKKGGCLSCGKPLLLRSHKDRTEDGLSEQRQRAAPFANFTPHDVPNATNLEGKHPMDSFLCVTCDATPTTEGTDIMGNRHEISIRSVILTPAGGRRVSLFISMRHFM
jgi:hypothetical protein